MLRSRLRFLSLRACEAISLFCLPPPNNQYRHTQRAHCATLAMTKELRSRPYHLSKPPLGVASLRSNLSFLCSPIPENRDRHTQRAHCAALAMTESVLAATGERRDCRATLAKTGSLCSRRQGQAIRWETKGSGKTPLRDLLLLRRRRYMLH